MLVPGRSKSFFHDGPEKDLGSWLSWVRNPVSKWKGPVSWVPLLPRARTIPWSASENRSLATPQGSGSDERGPGYDRRVPMPSVGKVGSCMFYLKQFVMLTLLAMAPFSGSAWAQKSGPSSSQPSRTGSPSTTTTPPPSNTPSMPQEQQLIFISGKVMTDDGTSVPRDVTIERLCNSRVVQQTHAASNGTFSMQIGGMSGPLFDGTATADADPGVGRFGTMGPAAQSPGFSMGGRRDLAYCELQAYSPGFRSSVVNLVEYNASGSVIDVGAIVLQRGEKVQGTTLSATTFAAPKDAKKAYQKGMEAESKGKLPEAKGYFEKTVEIYPKHAEAWVRLGQLLERENDTDGARKAYSSALAADSRFVPPYLMLAAIGVRSGAWNDVLNLTDHALELDPLSYPDAYFYNSYANLKVDRVDAAEKSARAAERLDVRHRIPQVHLLLADILARHENYHDAIGEMQTYLKLAPNGKDAEQVRSRLAQIEKDQASASQSPKP